MKRFSLLNKLGENNMKNEQHNKGGFRKGSGRKASNKKSRTIRIYLTEEHWNQIEKLKNPKQKSIAKVMENILSKNL